MNLVSNRFRLYLVKLQNLNIVTDIRNMIQLKVLLIGKTSKKFTEVNFIAFDLEKYKLVILVHNYLFAFKKSYDLFCI